MVENRGEASVSAQPSSFSVRSDVFVLSGRVLDPCPISALVLILIILLIVNLVPVLFVFSEFDLVV